MVKVRVDGREGREMPLDLSASAARMVVAAASTAPSETAKQAKQQVALLLGRGDSEQELLAELQLDQTSDQLQATAGLEREQARAAQEAVWRTQLADLEADELQRLVNQIQADLKTGMAKAAKEAQERQQWRDALQQWRDALQPLPKIFDWYKTNAFAGILLAAGFVVLKGYVIARGDLATALGILQYAGLTTVVTASLLSSLPILAAAMLAYTVFEMTGSHATAGRTRQLGLVMLGAFVLAAMFTPWTYLVLAVGIGLVIALLKTRPVPKPAAWLLSVLVTVLAAVAVILNLYTVWVPHEIVHFPPSTLKSEPQVGYVLSEDNGWITMLTSGPHQIVRYPDAKVVTQMVCERHPRRGDFWSEVRDGATLWDEVTAHEPDLHPAVNKDCSD
jgi:hypothetical protein